MLLPMSPADSMFLLGESPEHPMHFGALTLLRPPEGADARDVRALFEAAVTDGGVAPFWRKKIRRSLTSILHWGWESADDLDIEHHVRYTTLPQPGGVDELLALVSRLHGSLLHRHRPLWEVHLIEGLADGRYAVYSKIHHALADGVAAMRLLRSALSADADERGMPAPWGPLDPTPPHPSGTGEAFDLPVPAAVRDAVGDAAGLLSTVAAMVERALHGQGGPLSLGAPRTMFNVPITGARRFAAKSWPLERLRLIAALGGATINDVVLAMCAGALRGYLARLDALPDDPLIAMVPVSLRTERNESRTGNNVGVLMCNLATHLPDPARRLAAVHTSMVEGKEALGTMRPTHILAMSALGVAPLALGMLLGHRGSIRPPFNVIISNVPGPDTPLYWNGARVDALYPVSIPVGGQALNITCTSNDNSISFGLTSCRRSVPRLELLLDNLDDELGALERAVGV